MASNRKYEEPHPKHRPAGVPAQPRTIDERNAEEPVNDARVDEELTIGAPAPSAVPHVATETREVERDTSGEAVNDSVIDAPAPSEEPAPSGDDPLVKGDRVLFANEHPDATPHTIAAVVDGDLVELEDMTGHFAAHLFVRVPEASAS